MHRLFVYANSSALHHIEKELISRFSHFVRSWPVEGVLLTNKKAPLMDGQELPDWNIGLRVETSTLSDKEVNQLLSFVAELSRSINLPFVLGTWEKSSGTHDLCIVDQQAPDGAQEIIREGYQGGGHAFRP